MGPSFTFRGNQKRKNEMKKGKAKESDQSVRLEVVIMKNERARTVHELK